MNGMGATHARKLSCKHAPCRKLASQSGAQIIKQNTVLEVTNLIETFKCVVGKIGKQCASRHAPMKRLERKVAQQK